MVICRMPRISRWTGRISVYKNFCHFFHCDVCFLSWQRDSGPIPDGEKHRQFALLSLAENVVHGIVVLKGKVVSITAKTTVRNDIGWSLCRGSNLQRYGEDLPANYALDNIAIWMRCVWIRKVNLNVLNDM